MLEGWARDGLTDEEIAKKMGICPATLYVWKERFAEIAESIKKGKAVIDYEVEQTLLKKAMGHTIKETRKEVDANGKKRVVEIVREVPPDTAALIFWLRNRKPDRWRNHPNTPDAEDDKLIKYMEGMKNA